MYQEFENIHSEFERLNEEIYKGTQLYFSPLKESKILFVGINPGTGYFKFNNKNVKRFKPLEKFEYNGQKYFLAAQSKKIFKEIGLGTQFSQAVKINHFPFATANERAWQKFLNKHDEEYKLYYLSKRFVLQTIDRVKPKLIVCEGKSSFDRLKKILEVNPIEYNENTFVLRYNDCIVIGFRRHLSYIKDRQEFKTKISQYYKQSPHIAQ